MFLFVLFGIIATQKLYLYQIPSNVVTYTKRMNTFRKESDAINLRVQHNLKLELQEKKIDVQEGDVQEGDVLKSCDYEPFMIFKDQKDLSMEPLYNLLLYTYLPSIIGFIIIILYLKTRILGRVWRSLIWCGGLFLSCFEWFKSQSNEYIDWLRWEWRSREGWRLRRKRPVRLIFNHLNK